MPRNTVKFALRMAPETQQLVREWYPKDNCQTQNEYIEKAIQFYTGYLSGQEATAYLPAALVSALRGTVQNSENHIVRLLFKLAVELDMMMNVMAVAMEVDKEELDRLRLDCIKDVKKTHGSISFKDAVELQQGAR